MALAHRPFARSSGLWIQDRHYLESCDFRDLYFPRQAPRVGSRSYKNETKRHCEGGHLRLSAFCCSKPAPWTFQAVIVRKRGKDCSRHQGPSQGRDRGDRPEIRRKAQPVRTQVQRSNSAPPQRREDRRSCTRQTKKHELQVRTRTNKDSHFIVDSALDQRFKPVETTLLGIYLLYI